MNWDFRKEVRKSSGLCGVLAEITLKARREEDVQIEIAEWI